jgi:hypothetical protein
MIKEEIQELQEQILGIKEDLVALGDLRPGALSEQYNVCGNPSCRCKDKRNPQKHGPYWQLSYTHKGKSTTEFVKHDDLDAVKTQIANYRRFKELTEKWIDLSIQLAKLIKIQNAQEANKNEAKRKGKTCG